MYTNLITLTNGPRAMPLESQQGGRRPAPLSTWLNDADTSQVSDAAVTLWLQIDQALHPIIGHRGVAALFNRSVKLTAARFPWLGQDPQDALAVVDPSVLKAALLLQTAAEATAGVDSLFQSLHDLLTSLIGSSLTDQLLRSVWAHPPGEARDRHPH
jgi:hypothetical protein